MLDFNLNDQNNTVIIEGSTHSSGFYLPRLNEDPNAKEDHWLVNCSQAFRLKIVGSQEELIDNGAFRINGIQIRILLYNHSTSHQHLGLSVDAICHWADSQTWWYNKTPAMTTTGQVFIWVGGDWVDVVTLPSQSEIQAIYDAHKASVKEAWTSHYDTLREGGISGKDARGLMKSIKWDDVDSFLVIVAALRLHKFSPERLRYALKHGALKHAENVLGIGLCSYTCAEAAIQYRLKEMETPN